MTRLKLAMFALLAVAGLGCVDANGSTGTPTGDTPTNTDPTDLAGGWNATLYTLTSTKNSATTTDLVVNGFTVALTITNGGQFTRKISGGTFLNPTTETGTLLITGSDVKLTLGGKISTGTVSRINNTMTLDLSGEGVLWDFDHDGTNDPATLHAKFVQG